MRDWRLELHDRHRHIGALPGTPEGTCPHRCRAPWSTSSWSSSRRRSTPARPGRLHLVQLLDFANAGHALGTYLVDVQLVELKAPIDTGRPEATSPGAAAGSRRRRPRAWCAPGRRPATRHKVRITEKQLLSSEKTTSSPPQAAQGGD